MKLAAQRVGTFLRDPGSCRVVLLYGDDAGMIRDRAEALVRAVAGSLDDPFLIAELRREEIGRLADEAASLSLTGGRRVVRVRDVTEAAGAAVTAVLKGPAPALVVLEGPNLESRSRLRALIEASPDGAAIGCYPEEGRALEDTIRATLGSMGITIDADAMAWVAGQLGADRASTRQEVEKLGLYVGGTGGRVDVDSAMACVGDVAGLSLDDALFAATEGDVGTADRALELAIAEGAASVGILRASLMHLQRLHRARVAMDDGLSAAEAARLARPPVFFRRTSAFNKALGAWSSDALMAALKSLADAERACKRTGAPDAVIARNAVLALARRAAAVRGPRASAVRN